MSILIKGMEMPKNCWDCPLINTSPCACKWYSAALEYTTNRHPDCPLVPVPPHGRLIDADALEDDDPDVCNSFMRDGYVESCEWGYSHAQIKNAPTIIPAEEEES